MEGKPFAAVKVFSSIVDMVGLEGEAIVDAGVVDSDIFPGSFG